MRDLTASLLAAQKEARGTPYFKLYISDRLGEQYRLHWEELYTDEVDDYPQAMVVAGDGSIVRVLSDNGTAKYQRVTSPTTEAQWESWTGGMGTCSTENQMALCASGAYVWWAYINAANTTIYVRESNDYGASWGSAVAAATCTSSYWFESVALAVVSGTDLILFYSKGEVGVGLSVDLLRVKRVSGAWGSASGWGKDGLYRIRGLTCWKDTDYNMLYGGFVDAEPYGFEEGTALWGLWSVVYGGGGDVAADTWADPVNIERSDAGTAWAAAWPSLV